MKPASYTRPLAIRCWQPIVSGWSAQAGVLRPAPGKSGYSGRNVCFQPANREPVGHSGVCADVFSHQAELCTLHALAGDWAQAHDFARQTLQAREDESLLPATLTGWYEIEALLRGGDGDLARAEVQRLGEIVGDNKRYCLTLLRSQAVLGEWDEELDQAAIHLQTALALAQEIGLPRTRDWPFNSNSSHFDPIKGEAEVGIVVGSAVEEGLRVPLIGLVAAVQAANRMVNNNNIAPFICCFLCHRLIKAANYRSAAQARQLACHRQLKQQANGRPATS